MSGKAIQPEQSRGKLEATVTPCGAQTKYKKCSLHNMPVDSVG